MGRPYPLPTTLDIEGEPIDDDWSVVSDLGLETYDYMTESVIHEERDVIVRSEDPVEIFQGPRGKPGRPLEVDLFKFRMYYESGSAVLISVALTGDADWTKRTLHGIFTGHSVVDARRAAFEWAGLVEQKA